MKIKLPKQWKYWCRKARLQPESKYGKHSGFYLKGRNRRWRVNCEGTFECSCPSEHFDRWANSRGAEANLLPRTEIEFFAAVSHLIEKSKDAR